MYQFHLSTKFKRDFKKCKSQNRDMAKFKEIISLLEFGYPLPPHNKEHLLIGNWKGYRECHIAPDWLLIYRIHDDKKIIELSRIGSHSDLF